MYVCVVGAEGTGLTGVFSYPLQSHKFFSPVIWELVAKQAVEPPFKPKLVRGRSTVLYSVFSSSLTLPVTCVV